MRASIVISILAVGAVGAAASCSSNSSSDSAKSNTGGGATAGAGGTLTTGSTTGSNTTSTTGTVATGSATTGSTTSGMGGASATTGSTTSGMGGAPTTGSTTAAATTGASTNAASTTAAATTAASTTAASTSASTGAGAGPGGSGIFEAAEPWTTDVSAEAPSPTSTTVINWLNAKGWGAGALKIDFSITLQTAIASTPFKAFTPTGDFYTPDCDHVPMPVPVGGAIEGEVGYACTQGGDCHLLVIDPVGKKDYEMWEADIEGNTFNGGCLAVWDLTKAYPPNLRGDQCTSADAGGFPISAMLFTADEVAAGAVNHAIRFILPNASIRNGSYTHPGTHSTGSTSGPASAPPYGVHFRLKAAFNLASLPSDGARTVAKGLQKYGMYLADGGNIALTAASDQFTKAKWTDADVNMDSSSLSVIKVSDFEVVDLGATVPYTGDCVRNP